MEQKIAKQRFSKLLFLQMNGEKCFALPKRCNASPNDPKKIQGQKVRGTPNQLPSSHAPGQHAEQRGALCARAEAV